MKERQPADKTHQIYVPPLGDKAKEHKKEYKNLMDEIRPEVIDIIERQFGNKITDKKSTAYIQRAIQKKYREIDNNDGVLGKSILLETAMELCARYGKIREAVWRLLEPSKDPALRRRREALDLYIRKRVLTIKHNDTGSKYGISESDVLEAATELVFERGIDSGKVGFEMILPLLHDGCTRVISRIITEDKSTISIERFTPPQIKNSQKQLAEDTAESSEKNKTQGEKDVRIVESALADANAEEKYISLLKKAIDFGKHELGVNLKKRKKASVSPTKRKETHISPEGRQVISDAIVRHQSQKVIAFVTYELSKVIKTGTMTHAQAWLIHGQLKKKATLPSPEFKSVISEEEIAAWLGIDQGNVGYAIKKVQDKIWESPAGKSLLNWFGVFVKKKRQPKGKSPQKNNRGKK